MQSKRLRSWAGNWALNAVSQTPARTVAVQGALWETDMGGQRTELDADRSRWVKISSELQGRNCCLLMTDGETEAREPKCCP